MSPETALRGLRDAVIAMKLAIPPATTLGPQWRPFLSKTGDVNAWLDTADAALAAEPDRAGPLADSLDNDVMRGVIALALFRAGIRGSGKDGLPWIVAEGVQVALVASLRHAADVRAALAARSDSPLPVTVNERLDGTFGHGFTAGIRADVDRENSQRYVNTRAVIEWADLRTTGDVVNDITGRRGFWMPEADWNRIVAVARGNVSEAAQKVIDRVLSGDLS